MVMIKILRVTRLLIKVVGDGLNKKKNHEGIHNEDNLIEFFFFFYNICPHFQVREICKLILPDEKLTWL